MGLLDFFRHRATDPPTKDQFAQLLLTALRRLPENRRVEYVRADFQLRILEDGRQIGLSSLRTVYDEHCLLSTAERRVHLQRLVQSLATFGQGLPDDYEDVAYDLRPMVRARAFLSRLQLEQKLYNSGTPVDFPYRDIGSHLIAFIGYDLPHSIEMVPSESYRDWDKSFYELWETSILNLEAAPCQLATIRPGSFAMVTGDNYDSSRILLTDAIRTLDVQGEPVVLVPHRDLVLITGSEDAEGLAEIGEIARKELENPRAMTAIPLLLDGDDWLDWLPPPDHPAHDTYRELELLTLVDLYHEQRSLLRQISDQYREKWFPANYKLLRQAETGTLLSLSVWRDVAETHLPESNLIVFEDAAGQTRCTGRWEQVLDVCGDLIEPLADIYPALYRVRGFPTARQLDRLDDVSHRVGSLRSRR